MTVGELTDMLPEDRAKWIEENCGSDGSGWSPELIAAVAGWSPIEKGNE